MSWMSIVAIVISLFAVGWSLWSYIEIRGIYRKIEERRRAERP